MKKIYLFFVFLVLAITVGAQTVIDISTVDAAYTTTVDDELVIDVATASSAVASPNVSFANPFMGGTFNTAEVSFDVYNYCEGCASATDSIKVLGSLIAFHDAALGRMYFSNGSYLGFNIGGDNWFDANLDNYALDTDFLGGNAWKNVKLQFTAEGFALYVDDVLAYDHNSTDVTIAFGPNYDPATIIPFLQGASTLVIGTGSWWSDNTRADGSFWDAQFSYMKNITLTPDFTPVAVPKDVIGQTSTVVKEEYYSITGAKAGTHYRDLQPGLYIKKSTLDNGTFRSEKILKIYQYR
ncbi:MAG: hypothetical protein P1P82_15260 [Bacteroidales bacterium]|nr:hypothetical protein [Bacteroidales bacterium]